MAERAGHVLKRTHFSWSAVRVGWFVFHFVLIGLVCLHETLWLVKKHLTVVPSPSPHFWNAVDAVPAALVGDSLSSSNSYRQIIGAYLNAAGIEIGYGYFAPNVPEAHALVFEWQYPDGHVEYDKPHLQADGGGELRLTSLIQQIGGTDYEAWRHELVKRLAQAAWERHPDAVSVRAFLGALNPPTLAEYRAGKREWTFAGQSVYDFKRQPARADSKMR